MVGTYRHHTSYSHSMIRQFSFFVQIVFCHYIFAASTCVINRSSSFKLFIFFLKANITLENTSTDIRQLDIRGLYIGTVI